MPHPEIAAPGAQRRLAGRCGSSASGSPSTLGGEGADILLLACPTSGPSPVSTRPWLAEAFADAGADMLFFAAPTSRDELSEIGRRVPGHHLANMLEEGLTPICSARKLEDMGFKLVPHPFALLGPSILAMKRALAALREGCAPEESILFEELKEEWASPSTTAKRDPTRAGATE